MTERIRQLIIDELRTLPQHRIDRERGHIVCPYHNDTNPSGTVCLDIDQKGAPLGWFRCWTCKTSVPFNDLAQRLGLRKISHKKKTADDYIDPARAREALLNEEKEDLENYNRDYNQLEFFDFQVEEWRGFSAKYLQKVGAKFCLHDYTSDFYIFFPVMIEGEMKGYVKSELNKPKKRLDRKGNLFKPPAHINAPGKWAQVYGLLFFDYAVAMMKRKGLKTLVLCEGPRSALRCLRAGIPTIAILGAGNWNEEKRYILEKTGADNLILFFDGDDAGKEATEAIYTDVNLHFTTKYLSLWKKAPGSDPFDCDPKFIRQIKKALV